METKSVTMEKKIQLYKDYPQTASKNNPHTSSYHLSHHSLYWNKTTEKLRKDLKKKERKKTCPVGNTMLSTEFKA